MDGAYSRFYDTQIQSIAVFLYHSAQNNHFSWPNMVGRMRSERCRLRR
jgi:hypothetical protein